MAVPFQWNISMPGWICGTPLRTGATRHKWLYVHHQSLSPLDFSDDMYSIDTPPDLSIVDEESHSSSVGSSASPPSATVGNSTTQQDLVRKAITVCQPFIRNSSYATPHTQLLIHNSSYTTPHTQLIIHNSSYATPLEPNKPRPLRSQNWSHWICLYRWLPNSGTQAASRCYGRHDGRSTGCCGLLQKLPLSYKYIQMAKTLHKFWMSCIVSLDCRWVLVTIPIVI